MEEKLPEELLDRIVSLAPRDSLIHLCLTSRTLNRITTPYLYGDIILKSTYNIPALAYLIFTSSAHAALVQSLIVPNSWESGDEEDDIGWSWLKSDDPKLHLALQNKCSEYWLTEEEWSEIYGSIKSDNKDFLLAVLIASLPRLRRLNINFGSSYDHKDFVSFWPTLIYAIRSLKFAPPNEDSHASRTFQLTRLPALSVPLDIMVTGVEDKYPNSPVDFAVFINLPNLRSIYGWGMGDGDGGVGFDSNPETNPFVKLRPRSCPVEYIELRKSKLHTENFQHLLQATIPGKLKMFSYEVGGTWAWTDVEHPMIMTSLEPHHDTLDSLCLSHEDFYPYEDDFENGKPDPCCFVPFTALKRLKVAPLYIWGNSGVLNPEKFNRQEAKGMLWKALPRNLEELWVTRAQWQNLRDKGSTASFIPKCLLPALDLVIQNKHYVFPKLQRLRVEFPPSYWEFEWFDVLASICKAAYAKGVHTTIIFSEIFDRYEDAITVERPWGWDEDIEWEPPRYSSNRESAKVWIPATTRHDLAEALKDIKIRFEKESDTYTAALRVRMELRLCSECYNDPAYAARIDQAQIARFIEKRLDTKGCYRWSDTRPTIET